MDYGQQVNPVFAQMNDRIAKAAQVYQAELAQAHQMAQQAGPLVQQAQNFLQNPMGTINQIANQAVQQVSQKPMPQFNEQMIKEFQADPETVRLTSEYFNQYMLVKYGQEFANSAQGKSESSAILDGSPEVVHNYARKCIIMQKYIVGANFVRPLYFVRLLYQRKSPYQDATKFLAKSHAFWRQENLPMRIGDSVGREKSLGWWR